MTGSETPVGEAGETVGIATTGLDGLRDVVEVAGPLAAGEGG
jgi:hypothetical protein